ncbi:MAG: hypothetical protein GWP10_22020 [Nitrospiraceae bacterium]|nr:hypothetical protein [Nitrospiraceae bacterium]
MTEIEKYIPKGVIKRISFKNESELIFGAKKLYLEQMCHNVRGGKKFIEYLEQIYGIEPSKNSVEELCEKMKLAEVYYYFYYLYTATRGTVVFKFKKAEDTNWVGNPELFSDFGQPIWDQELEDKPKLWLCCKEDGDHVFLTFIFTGKEKHYFDSISQSFTNYTETGIVNCRIHFGDQIIEVIPNNTGADFVDETLEYIKREFNISRVTPISIDDQDIRDFDRSVVQVTHEKREGDEATTALTRANNDGDTRNDVLHRGIENREFKKEHGVLEINSANRAIVGLTRGEMGKIQFKSRLVPADRSILFHKLKDILKW